MRLRHCAIAISFSMSFAMSCQRRASSSKSQAAQASMSFILREISQALFSNQDALLSVAAWANATGVTNVRAPIALDASNPVWPIASADGIICINMVHISPWDATLGLIKGAAAILPPGGDVRPMLAVPLAMLDSSYEQPVPIFQQLAGGHLSGRDDVRAIPAVAAQRRRCWTSAGSTSAMRPSGSGGTGLARCSPPRFARDESRTCAPILSGTGTWMRCL